MTPPSRLQTLILLGLLFATWCVEDAPGPSSGGLLSAAEGPVWKYPPEMAGSRQVVFKRVGEVELRAWVFEPPGHKPSDRRPAIIFYFGGGWRGGTPGQFYPQCRYLASRGMVALTVDYRVLGRHNVLAPVCLQDAKSAIRWVRQNATTLGVDPHKIVAAGGSAGGHLAACTGLIGGFDDPMDKLDVSSVPNAMALYNPAVLLSAWDGKQQLEPDKIKDIAERTGGESAALSPLLKVRAGLPPSIIFHGTEDEAVPFWTVAEFAQRMRAAGNRCELKACQDAPHGFFNTGRGGSAERQDLETQRYAATTLQLDTFLQSLGYLSGPATIAAVPDPAIELRGDYKNSRRRFEKEKRGHVAFLGGSITEMDGYRPMVQKWLQQRFPQTRFEFTNAGIASTCSTTGAFRLRDDVLSKGPVDLLFVEFAVNDDQDANHRRPQCIRGMEGIVRQLLRHNPRADVVMTHFVNQPMLTLVQAKKVPVSIEAHQAVARHYQVSSINVAAKLADQIQKKAMTWQQYGGTHPQPAGNRLCADMIAELLGAAWALPFDPDSTVTANGRMLPAPLDQYSYEYGQFLPQESARLGPGWQRSVPLWNQLPGSSRSRFTTMPVLHADKADSKLELTFNGSAIGAYVLAGPDAGIVAFEIDGQRRGEVDLYHRFSKGLHYPRTVMFAEDLPPGNHQLTLRVGARKEPQPAQQSGSAIRILRFVANGAK